MRKTSTSLDVPASGVVEVAEFLYICLPQSVAFPGGEASNGSSWRGTYCLQHGCDCRVGMCEQMRLKVALMDVPEMSMCREKQLIVKVAVSKIIT